MRKTDTPIPDNLATTSAGRDYITTPEFAHAVNCADQTVRKNYCIHGECFGIRPVKVGGRLLWPVLAIAKLLNGELTNKEHGIRSSAKACM